MTYNGVAMIERPEWSDFARVTQRIGVTYIYTGGL